MPAFDTAESSAGSAAAISSDGRSSWTKLKPARWSATADSCRFSVEGWGSNIVPKRAGADGYEDVLGGAKPAKGERVAVVPYLEADESLLLREPAQVVGEADGRVLLQGGVIVVVTDRKFIAANTSGGFRPHWEVFSLPYGHLEPGISASGTVVSIPTSGRRRYRAELADIDSAARLAGALGDALRVYRRERMGLDDS